MVEVLEQVQVVRDTHDGALILAVEPDYRSEDLLLAQRILPQTEYTSVLFRATSSYI